MNWYKKIKLASAISEGKVLAHIAGPSGSGKTTLLKKLSGKFKDIAFKDLDEMDDQAVFELGWKDIPKKKYSDEMIENLGYRRQKILDDYISSSFKPVVLGGHHTEGDFVLDVYTKNRFLLDVDAKTSAERAYERSQNEEEDHKRKLEELPEDIKEAEEIISFLKSHGYVKKTASQIEEWISNKV